MRSFSTWPAPQAGGGTSEECALVFDQNRERRVLILPALFEEANKLRRFTAEVMRRLDLSGIDSVLPDLPGNNDSPAPLADQTLANWRLAADFCAGHFRATHILSIRAGALMAPTNLPGWRYAPSGGKKQLRSMLRARTIASRELGREETLAELESAGRKSGIELVGWKLGARLFTDLNDAAVPDSGSLLDIEQEILGDRPLWLRAEPDEDHEQADALAAIIAVGLSET